MAIYIESSFLLSILLEEDPKETCEKIWIYNPDRVSSILIDFETLNTLRRFHRHNKSKLDPNWFKKKSSLLNNLLKEVNRKKVEEEILHIFKLKESLSNLYSLDSIHMSTFVYYHEQLDGKISLCSLDKEIRKLAKTMKFKLLPENYPEEKLV